VQQQDAWEVGLRQGFGAQWSAFGRVGRSFRFVNAEEIYEFDQFGGNEFQLLRLRPGATVRQAFDYWIARFTGDTPPGPPPAQFVGGLSDLRPGVHGWVSIDLPPGTYGVWSIEDGDFTDVENGLIATFTVRS